MKERIVNDVNVLPPRGYLTGGEETNDLEDRIKKILNTGTKRLIINLQETQHLNHSALGVLISGHASFVRAGGRLKLCSLDQRLQNILVITKLSTVFDTYDNEASALASFTTLPT